MKKIYFVFTVFAVTLLLYSCTASYDIYSSKNPEFSGRINKMLVYVLKLDSINGQEMEEEVSNSLNYGMKRADPFSKIFPDSKKNTAAEILGNMQNMGYDGLLIVSPYEGGYDVNPVIPKINYDQAKEKGDVIKSYVYYKANSDIYLSTGFFCAEIALFNVSDEMLIWRSSAKTEVKMFEYMGSRVSKFGQTIFEELQKNKIIK